MESSFNYYDEATIKHNIANIAKEIDAEEDKEIKNNAKITKLRFAQLMQGLYLQNF